METTPVETFSDDSGGLDLSQMDVASDPVQLQSPTINFVASTAVKRDTAKSHGDNQDINLQPVPVELKLAGHIQNDAAKTGTDDELFFVDTNSESTDDASEEQSNDFGANDALEN